MSEPTAKRVEMPPSSTDDEPTDPLRALSFAMQFRCSVCEMESLVDEPTSTAPRCVTCDRFMAPVNAPTARGQA